MTIYNRRFVVFLPFKVVSNSIFKSSALLSSGCGWRNGLQYGG